MRKIALFWIFEHGKLVAMEHSRIKIFLELADELMRTLTDCCITPDWEWTTSTL
jgi:hypothetical protein